MSQNKVRTKDVPSVAAVSGKIDEVLAGIRVPDLPYPAGKLNPDVANDWLPLLNSCWAEQRDERVTHLIRSVHLEWSARQVNAAYVADRIMDVFLKTSGLHPSLTRRVARLRFYFAWRMNLEGKKAFSKTLLTWLDSLQEWRGWSDSGGRSAKALLDQLDALVIAVSASFASDKTDAVEAFCHQWQKDSTRRMAQAGKLRQRLLETEQGAAKQRKADQCARALVGRALQGRSLPLPIVRFILDYWLGLLKQSVWNAGLEGEAFRHGGKLLEWLVWIGDPQLSDKDRNRLYHVGEQIGDRILDVWKRVYSETLPAETLAGIESVMVSRLRGEVPDLVDALSAAGDLQWDSSWLSFEVPARETFQPFEGRWFVEGEGTEEQRRYFYAFLSESAEILWTNGAGVKLGLQDWSEFQASLEKEQIRPLPKLAPFGKVLAETVELLAGVCEKQRQQREQAAEAAKKRAEELRREKDAAEAKRRAEEEARAAVLEQERQAVEQQRIDDENAEKERIWKERKLLAEKQVDAIKLGGWIVVEPNEKPEEAVRLKLAVRINASRKLVFVDRLGLNRREFLEEELVEKVAEGRIRVLGTSAEFDDALSRVVGRIRVGRN
ncbi:DUF1631 family protein [Marinobacter sp. F3R08]|uniref:DUF1631 family protein n=1 Tax=Marinobacter sp. F3R08 TaxID=2841559 RepID=UPI001C08EE4C|nr:DUF1631 family protein [Marinobacter sp. F3R08]MBU2955700.1 DUF1631 domain-containing protein [Marinobacter sp. F3R08]